MIKFNTRQKLEKKYDTCKIEGAHLQCVNNHYAKFEYKGINTLGVTEYTNLAPPKNFEWRKCLSSTTVKNEKKIETCTKKEVHIFNVLIIIMQSLNIKE